MPTPQTNAFPGLAVLAIALLLAGCGGSNSGGTSSSTTAGPPVSGGSIVYGADREPTCLDPHNLGDMPQTYVARQYLDSLVSEKRDGTVVPWLADSWTISPDGLTYIFKIKQGVKFHDGTPLDAAAVKANFEHMLDPATQSLTDAGYLKPYYKSSRAVDPSTFELSLSTPYSALLQVLSQAFFGIQSPKALARGLDANRKSPVGTGPFIVKQWVHGKSVELDRNPNYNSAPPDAKHQGPAYLDHIGWKFLEDGSVRFAAVAGQGADLIFNPPPQQNAALKSDPNLVLQEFTHTDDRRALRPWHPAPGKRILLIQSRATGSDEGRDDPDETSREIPERKGCFADVVVGADRHLTFESACFYNVAAWRFTTVVGLPACQTAFGDAVVGDHVVGGGAGQRCVGPDEGPTDAAIDLDVGPCSCDVGRSSRVATTLITAVAVR
jgi:hypothetical protein